MKLMQTAGSRQQQIQVLLCTIPRTGSVKELVPLLPCFLASTINIAQSKKNQAPDNREWFSSLLLLCLQELYPTLLSSFLPYSPLQDICALQSSGHKEQPGSEDETKLRKRLLLSVPHCSNHI